ncbi:SMEK domain-containing protein [Chitinophaga niabensis]|uniref:SMEK domain-containing protein n=1 Tax=Chitinophaga niabensis TaxID=536979 RepID=UPI0031BA03CF
MVRKDLIESIVNYASLFVLQIKGQSAMDYHDVSIHAEQTSIPILNKVFDLELKSANEIKRNHPAIDLIDDKKGVAFQITSTATQEKIEKTLRGFVDNNLYELYPTLYIYILTEKRSSYSIAKLKRIVNDKFDFDPNVHIIDYRHILARIRFISSLDALNEIANFYEKLSAISISHVTSSIENQQHVARFKAGKQLSYIDRVKNELEDVIGTKNIHRIPELPELFSKISGLEDKLSDKEKELKECRTALDNYPDHEALHDVLTRAYVNSMNECEVLKQMIEQEKMVVSTLSQNIRHQKEFLDQINQQQVSERMKEAKRLFEEGEYVMVNLLLNYEGRQNYISKKLEEKGRQSIELKALANEEVFLALSMLQKQNWSQNIHEIREHFEQSIELGGYGFNSYQYSFFLEDIELQKEAIDILTKTIAHIPDDEMENKAASLRRLGKLLQDSDEGGALKAFTEAIAIYEDLSEKDSDGYAFLLADCLFGCGTLQMKKSLELARVSLDRAVIILGTRKKPPDLNIRKLQYLTLIGLGSLHQKRDDTDSSIAFLNLALYMGAGISLDNPEDDLLYLLEAVKRFRILFGEEKEGPHSDVIYKHGLRHFVRIQKWHSQDDAYNNAKALNKLGLFLLQAQETTGAGICFRGALKIFKALDKEGYSCLPDISSSLEWVGFIHMTANNVKAQKKVLLEALNIRKQLAETDPVGNLPEVASLLNNLYNNSFIAVGPSQYYKAYPFFDEALGIYKQLDERYEKPHFIGWLQLLQNRSIFLSKGLDKTDVIVWYQEFIGLISRIPPKSLPSYEKNICKSIHEVGELLLKNVSADHHLFLTMAEDLIKARNNLVNKNPKEYDIYLLYAFLEVGYKLADIEQWEKACPYLRNGIDLLKELTKKYPDKYDKEIVMPTLKLAQGYDKLKDYASSAGCFADLCSYFESRLIEHPEYHDIMVSIMLSLTEQLLLDDQKEQALNYITKAMTYLSTMTDSSEQNRLKGSFEELIKEHFL